MGTRVLVGVDSAVMYMAAIERGAVLLMARCILEVTYCFGVFGVGCEGPAMI